MMMGLFALLLFLIFLACSFAISAGIAWAVCALAGATFEPIMTLTVWAGLVLLSIIAGGRK